MALIKDKLNKFDDLFLAAHIFSILENLVGLSEVYPRKFSKLLLLSRSEMDVSRMEDENLRSRKRSLAATKSDPDMKAATSRGRTARAFYLKTK